MCRVATGRRQAKHMHFEWWLYCFLLTHKVNTEQRVRHMLPVQIVSSLQSSPWFNVLSPSQQNNFKLV
jgi:hypothetical protein